MSLTLSPPIRIAALVAALLLTALAATMFLLARGLLGEEATSTANVNAKAKPAVAPPPTPRSSATPRAQRRVPSGFPKKIDHALRYSRVVIVSVSLPGAAVDAAVRREARAAAKTSGAGFVAISGANERALSGLVAKTGVLPAPAVVIVRRPGVVVSTFSVTDASTIAQAVVQARR